MQPSANDGADLPWDDSIAVQPAGPLAVGLLALQGILQLPGAPVAPASGFQMCGEGLVLCLFPVARAIPVGPK